MNKVKEFFAQLPNLSIWGNTRIDKAREKHATLIKIDHKKRQSLS